MPTLPLRESLDAQRIVRAAILNVGDLENRIIQNMEFTK